MEKARRTTLAMSAALLAALLALGGVASAQQQQEEGTTAGSTSAAAQTEGSGEQLRVGKPGGGDPGPLSPVQKKARSQGYLVPDQEAYELAKAEAERLSGTSAPAAPEARASEPPEVFRSWEGVRDRKVTPSDSTGAICPTRYIELVNQKYAIYDRSHDAPISKGSLNKLAGEPPFPQADVFDPQIIWDPATERFYYVAADIISETDTRLAFGFSKTSNPSSAADFCKYTIGFGTRFPDYPKLGDTRDLLLIGANSFDFIRTFEFLGSDLISVTKPPSGNRCPERSRFTVDAQTDLRGADRLPAFTPVPANQIDTRDAGHVVAISEAVYTEGNADLLNIYRVTKNRDGTMNLSGPRRLSVSSYRFPANAPQPNTKNVLDTLDARNTQAITAVDPSPGEMALWTQHTVFGGSRAEVRWYEIDLTAPYPSLLQRGRLSSLEGTFFFNAAISPDRQINGATRRFGDAMAIGYNTSSKSHRPDIRVISKEGTDPLSQQKLVKASPAVMNDIACRELRHVCRWGDYSAATPDPKVPAGETSGRVWLSNQWVKTPGSFEPPAPFGWSTWNWAVRP